MPEPDCFLRYRIGYGTLQPCLGCQRAALLRGILRRENPTYTYWLRAARASRGFKIALFTDQSEDLFGGKCGLPSARLVFDKIVSCTYLATDKRTDGQQMDSIRGVV